MRDNLTDITIVLDRSGSMSTVQQDTIGGFNTFLNEQKNAPGDATLSLVQFDDHYEVVHTAVNIKDVPELNETTFVPRGMTALLDAIGKTIVTTGQRLAAMAEADRPSKVVFVILTDGGENSSREYIDSSKIKEMIKHQTEAYNWDFVFLGANQDAITVASSMGMLGGNAMTYASNSAGTASAFTSVANAMNCYRSGDLSKKTAFFTDEDRTLQEAAGA